MNSKDKKIYKSVVEKVVRSMEPGKIIDKKEFSSLCAQYGYNIDNPSYFKFLLGYGHNFSIGQM
jgi:hypothetical protein